jgi:hypothetical protein
MKKTLVVILVILCGTAPLAHAARPAIDTLTLSDGTVLRGHATELKPGDHVELVLLDGRVQTVAWNEIVASDGPSFPFDPAAAFLAPGPGRVPLEVDSSVAARIGVHPQPDLGGPCIPVCASTPCTLYVAPGDLRLDVSGEGVVAYATEVVVPASGARISLKPGNAAESAAGTRLIIASIPLTIAGAVLAGVGSTMGHEPSFSGTKLSYSDNRAPMEGVGGAMVGVGVGALVSGIVLVARSHSGSESLQPLDGQIHF